MFDVDGAEGVEFVTQENLIDGIEMGVRRV
jgi:hypothetical protein